MPTPLAAFSPAELPERGDEEACFYNCYHCYYCHYYCYQSIRNMGEKADLPTPLAAFSPAELPERGDEEAPLSLVPVPMDQSLSPELRDEPWLGRGVVLAWPNMPTWRDMLSKELNQSSISRVGSRPADNKDLGVWYSCYQRVVKHGVGVGLAKHAHLARHVVQGAEPVLHLPCGVQTCTQRGSRCVVQLLPGGIKWGWCWFDETRPLGETCCPGS